MKSALTFLAFVALAQCVARGQVQPQKADASAPPPPNAARPSAGRAVMLPPEKAQPVRVPRFEKPPAIDGRLDDEVWKSAVVLKDFYQTHPGDNTPPSQPTEVLLAYDEKFLYIAFRAHDEPGKVRATIAKRDAVFDDDHVGVYLDTFNDQRRAYELFFNPLGVQHDGIFTEGRGDDFTVDIVMESKGLLGADGYAVEVAVPFKSLRYRAGKDQVWGVNFIRRIKRADNELSSWMPQSRDISGFLNQAGRITGLEGIWAGRALEIIPSLTLSETGRRVRALPPAAPADPGRFVNQPVHLDPGLNLKFSIAPNVTLDFAANPDFAHVEADQLVVTANERFPIFFPEKRPFFLEGVDIFQTPLNAVHTRTIIDPDYAFKLTGKRGRTSFGLLLASDNAPGNFSEEERNDPATRPRFEKFLNKNAYVGVLRLKRYVGKESSIGLIATSYNFVEKRNQAGGCDGRFRLDRQTVFSFHALGLNSRQFLFDPDLGRRVYRTWNGFGYFWNYNRSGRHFGHNLTGRGLTRDYRANVGFTRRTGTNFVESFIRYNSEPKPKAALISWSFRNINTILFDWSGRMQRWEHIPHVSFSLKYQTVITPFVFHSTEQVFEDEFGRRRTETRPGAFAGDSPKRRTYYKGAGVEFQTTPSKKYSLRLDTHYAWNWFDFDLGAGPRFPRVSPAALLDPGAPLDPGPGNLWFARAVFTYQPTDALRTSLDYTKSRLARRDTRRVAFDSNLYSLRTTYQFTRFTFARARVDFDSLASNARGQFLLGWTPSPGTSFYVGYNDDLNHNGFSPFTGQREPGFRRNSRAFFIKTSYLFRRGL